MKSSNDGIHLLRLHPALPRVMCKVYCRLLLINCVWWQSTVIFAVSIDVRSIISRIIEQLYWGRNNITSEYMYTKGPAVGASLVSEIKWACPNQEKNPMERCAWWACPVLLPCCLAAWHVMLAYLAPFRNSGYIMLDALPPFHFFSLLLHTYLLEILLAHELENHNTRPSLHIEASRVVQFPSGTWLGEFLIANHYACVYTFFHWDLKLRAGTWRRRKEDDCCPQKGKVILPVCWLLYHTHDDALYIKTMANCTIALGVLLDILNITWLQAFTSNPPWVIPLNRMLQTCYLDTKPLKIPQNLTFKPTSLCDTCSKYELMV